MFDLSAVARATRPSLFIMSAKRIKIQPCTEYTVPSHPHDDARMDELQRCAVEQAARAAYTAALSSAIVHWYVPVKLVISIISFTFMPNAVWRRATRPVTDLLASVGKGYVTLSLESVVLLLLIYSM